MTSRDAANAQDAPGNKPTSFSEAQRLAFVPFSSFMRDSSRLRITEPIVRVIVSRRKIKRPSREQCPSCVASSVVDSQDSSCFFGKGGMDLNTNRQEQFPRRQPMEPLHRRSQGIARLLRPCQPNTRCKHPCPACTTCRLGRGRRGISRTGRTAGPSPGAE